VPSAGPVTVEARTASWGAVQSEPPSFGDRGTDQGADAVASAPAPHEDPARRGGWLRPALAGGVAGALVAALTTGGLFLATQDDDSQPVATVQAAPASTSGEDPIVGGALGMTASDVQRAYERIRPSVVSIATKGFDQSTFFGVEPSEGAGSGVILSKDGYVLTNFHVVKGATSIKVTLADRSTKTANLIGGDEEDDIAVLKITDATDLPAATLGSSAKLRIGDPVVAIGNALALPGGPTVTSGIVSALDRTIADSRTRLSGLIQTDAAINPGNSGGALVNVKGEVVGINTAIIQNSNNIGFAISIDRAKPIIDEIRKGKGSIRSQTFLGVSTQTVDEDLQRAYELPVAKGALVVEVVPGSPAESAGLAPGDVVTKFGDRDVASSEALVEAVRAAKAGEQVTLTYRRGDAARTARVTLGSRGAQATG
jgi:S1-C subfamily serine protease